MAGPSRSAIALALLVTAISPFAYGAIWKNKAWLLKATTPAQYSLVRGRLFDLDRFLETTLGIRVPDGCEFRANEGRVYRAKSGLGYCAFADLLESLDIEGLAGTILADLRFRGDQPDDAAVPAILSWRPAIVHEDRPGFAARAPLTGQFWKITDDEYHRLLRSYLGNDLVIDLPSGLSLARVAPHLPAARLLLERGPDPRAAILRKLTIHLQASDAPPTPDTALQGNLRLDFTDPEPGSVRATFRSNWKPGLKGAVEFTIDAEGEIP